MMSQAVVAHTLIPIPTLGSRGMWMTELMANLVYKMSSRTAKITQKNLISKKET